MESENKSLFERFSQWLRASVIVKLLFIGFAMLLLLIPQSMVRDLVREREQTRDGVIGEVSEKWGSAQYLVGLVVTLPYSIQTPKGIIKGYFHLLPDRLEVNGKLEPHVRYRSLYEVLLYNAQLAVKGTLTLPNLAPYGIQEKDVAWEQAVLSVGISDLRGIKEPITIMCNNASYETSPGLATQNLLPDNNGVSALIALKQGQKLEFAYKLNLNGSQRLFVAPVGKITLVKLISAWPTPSFMGSFLPDERTVNADGFAASWQVLHVNRNIPQAFKKADWYPEKPEYARPEMDNAVDLTKASFGVDLLPAIDGYQTTERSTKYGSMLVLLTFLTFFLVEVMSGKRFHPVQYLLVGFTLVMFYLLLLSLGEYIAFGWAYLAGCVLIVALVTYYARFVFQSTKLMLSLFGILVAAYGFFYMLLQLADYALIIGTFGLLGVLALVIYITRKFDWYNLRITEDNKI